MTVARDTAGRPKPIPVVVVGAAGKMGREVVRAIANARGMELAGAIDIRCIGADAGEVAGLEEALEIPICGAQDLAMVLTSVAQDKERYGVLVDFSAPDAVMENYKQAIAFGIRPIIGTTGFSAKDLKDMMEFADMSTMGAIVSPSFSIGLAMVQQAAQNATFHYTNVEVHETLSDPSAATPSTTAVATAEALSGLGRMYNRPPKGVEPPPETAALGAVVGDGVRVHSSVSPGLVAEQEVRFSAGGETLSFKHTVTDYKAYVPGVLLSIRKIVKLKTFVYGIDKLL